MIHLKLTREEARFVRDRMRLTAMNESGQTAALASQIVETVETELAGSQIFREIREMFADLYPEGRE